MENLRPLTVLLRPRDYTVGLLCTLPIQVLAARAMLDAAHPPLPLQASTDTSVYQFGRIGAHNVVVACPPADTGASSAALATAHMRASFPGILYLLRVSIGGGVPRKTRNAPDAQSDHIIDNSNEGSSDAVSFDEDDEGEADVRLGDVVVGLPTGSTSGVVQYDLARTLADGRLVRAGDVQSPPPQLLAAISCLMAQHMMLGNGIADALERAALTYPCLRAAVSTPARLSDWLFDANYDHVGGYAGGGDSSAAERNSMCQLCDTTRLMTRTWRVDDEDAATQEAGGEVALAAVSGVASSSTLPAKVSEQLLPPEPLPPAQPRVHYGLIASSSQAVQHGATRDLANSLAGGSVLCFATEAAGQANDVPSLDVRGISDYADSHKNGEWQEYAALTAIAYAKELVAVLPEAAAPEEGGGELSSRRLGDRAELDGGGRRGGVSVHGAMCNNGVKIR